MSEESYGCNIVLRITINRPTTNHVIHSRHNISSSAKRKTYLKVKGRKINLVKLSVYILLLCLKLNYSIYSSD